MEKNVKKFKLPKLESWLRTKLRRISIQWPAKNEALKRARAERGKYQCAECNKLFPHKKVHVDHLKSVINIKTGFTDWNEFISRLFVDIDGLQILCLRCHDNKTFLEDGMRMYYKNKKKKSKHERLSPIPTVPLKI